MSLKEYYEENVTIVTVSGVIFRGFVDDYVFPEDNEDGEESIILNTKNGEYLEFNKDTIKEIIIN